MPTILVVDDEQSFRSLLNEALNRAGYTVLLATNGEEALAAAKEPVDIPLVVTDFSMPGISGIDLVRLLREDRPNMKAILLSGHWLHPMPDDLDAVYLMKPTPLSKFLAVVKQLLGDSSTTE